MSRWFRWYEGTSEDGKFRVAARNAGVTVRDVIALWTFILEDASSEKHRGICTRDEDFMSSILDFDDGIAERILSAMEDLSMISVGHGAITVINWGKRQFETDTKDSTNAERQKRWRDNHKTSPKHDRNGTVTEAKRPDTESETDTEKKEGAEAHAKPIKKDRRRATRFPEGMESDLESQKSANITLAEGAREFTKFRNHALEKGRTCIDWRAAERNWYLKAAEFMGRKPLEQVKSEIAVIPNEFAVRMFKQTGRWNNAYGPEPGKPGCRASPEDLAKYGYQSEAA